MIKFENLSTTILDALKKENITEPTQIQAMVIPKILENKDLIVQSETGSGKTLAYLLPLFEKLQEQKKEMQVLILVPTHELAIQVQRQIERLSQNSDFKLNSTTIMGNVNIKRQVEKLREKPQIIVGSTGRILELIKMKKLSAHTIKTIVVDEADKMMDKDNIEGVKAVIKCTLKERQILLFSASISKETIDKANEIMKEPEVIKAANNTSIPTQIEHIFFVTERRDKLEVLRKVAVSLNPKKALVFINQIDEIELATKKLKFHSLNAEFIHGKNDKIDRKKVMDNFKAGKLQLLVASDLAARGIHVDDITCIFNLSMPEDPMDYLHRVGRTGRNGKAGLAVSIVTEREISLIKKYEKTFKIKIICKDMSRGNIIDKLLK
ncbi:MAG: box helicase domain protein [Clostridiales bacterium]|nr:box helicase domain protein [Clostridiales bacterium]